MSPVVNRYFQHWLLHDSWHSGHWADMERFFKFVKAVLRYSKKRPSDSEVRDRIMEREGLPQDDLEKRASHFAGLYAHILEFVGVGFPDALIEKTNIQRYHFSLEAALGHRNQAQIAEAMQREWGDDWRTMLELEEC